MDIASATLSASTAASETATSRTQIADKFDDFLLLLTTQLQNQDPLNPLDSTEFVAQLVSFTEVEQSINTNSHLEELVGLLRGGQAAAAVGYLGKTVEAEGDKAMLRDGRATFSYDPARQAAITTITLTDATGKVVKTLLGETSPGRHDLVWDGRDGNGVALPEGLYTISVKAKDDAGNAIPVSTTFIGRVVAVDQTKDGIFLDVDGTTLPLSSILAVHDSADGGAGS
ncbi:MAG: flagellar hook assembly protein FlgD [Alphaproteobacteria bacterium]